MENGLTTKQRFLKLQIDELKISNRWRDLFLELLPYRRMIILYPLQKQQIKNISNIDSDEVFKLAQDIINPSITLTLLEKLSIESTL